MNIIPHLVWAVVATATFALGYFASDSTAKDPIPTQPIPVAPAASLKAETVQASSDESGLRRPDSPGALSAEQARVRTFELLAVPDRVERLRQLCDLLARVTPENWKDVIKAFVIQTGTEGRTHREEWRLMLERVGQVAGAEALRDALERKSPDVPRAFYFIIGWAAADPTRAVEWFQAQPPDRQQLLFSQLVTGVARSDPKQALSLLFDKPPPQWERSVPGIIDGAIQLGGFRAAEDLYTSIARRPDVPVAGRGKVFYELAQRKVAMDTARGDPAATLAWVDHRLGETGPGATREIIRGAGKANPARTLAWLDERADRMVPEQSRTAYTALAEVWHQNAPEQLAGWISANPDHPQREAIAQTAARLAPREAQN
ncbi:MAG: hypothetical protein M3463_03100 [Verrucomicrobiota bacterium]|nr:hypothetical protein [Verrucomicrobiota bacterium]